jgi:colanic acid/amylovoran biosynthesis glycosyltransferase
VKIYFLVNIFPIISQTFVIDNITQIAKRCIPFKILTFKKNSFEEVSHLEKYNKHIKQDLIHEIRDTRKGFLRYFYSFLFLTNPRNLFFFIKVSYERRQLSFFHIYQMKAFYNISKKDIVHVHFANSIYYLIDFIKIGYISPKVLISVHGKDIIWLERFSRVKENMRFIDKFIFRILCNSNFTRNNLLNLGFRESQLIVHYLGVDITFFKPTKSLTEKKEKLNLVSVGRLINLKGHRYAIKAVKILKDKGVDLNYNIIGDGPDYKKLKKLIIEENLCDIVKLRGIKNKSDIRKYYDKADIFLFPSTFCDKTGRCEAFGVASIEAQAMGLPVIGFNSGGFPETIIEGATGFSVEDRNIVEFASKIAYLNNNPLILFKMRNNAITNISNNFSSTKADQELVKSYNF